MTHFTNLYQFKIESPNSMAQTTPSSWTASTLSKQANGDKVRLWQDFKTHRYVQALKDHEEFRDYVNQKVLTERQ